MFVDRGKCRTVSERVKRTCLRVLSVKSLLVDARKLGCSLFGHTLQVSLRWQGRFKFFNWVSIHFVFVIEQHTSSLHAHKRKLNCLSYVSNGFMPVRMLMLAVYLRSCC
ncbi:hypothetical protein SJAG_05889 [Schizosaccharomyces japonicus yFS275]|uniref:Uncharacterized protein n=1 Tax=Schizosaccharomyces japonicus (strain yFS275 / FY16936) TaxID=402676 RepID=T0S160_SCHJY|nr:hypothetical protein SJAG_05889 [Schizosaccharomyces japonicus yFS275]EQC53047.1 hypothetical protein SJAG_05889 [Schizosaccharomyces japonicus yFS275]